MQHRLLNGDYAGAKAEAEELLEIFGAGIFYLELQDQHLEEERAIYDDMLKLSRELFDPAGSDQRRALCAAGGRQGA